MKPSGTVHAARSQEFKFCTVVANSGKVVPQTEWEKSCNFKSIGDAAATTAKKRHEQSSLEDAILVSMLLARC